MADAPLSIKMHVAQAHHDGVVFDDNLPFLLTPQQPNGAGIVLVHGFSASPWEMRRFGEELNRCGYLCLGVRLPGHGTTPEDLAHRHYEEWLRTVKEACASLLPHVDRLYGIGMSTGALLLLLASTDLPLAGLVLLSPYLRLQHRLAPHAGILRFLIPYQQRTIEPPYQRYYYSRRPLHGVHQIQRLLKQVRKTLAQVSAPTLVVSGEGDRTVRIDSAFELHQRLTCPRKQYHRFGPDVPHVLTTEENPRLGEVLELTKDFIDEREKEKKNGTSAS